MMATRVLVAFMLAAGIARADDVVPPTDTISESDKKRANELAAEANELFGEQQYPAALAKYTAALAIWDHPILRLNTAVTLIRLDRYLDASEHLDAALRHGKTPFTEEKYQLAMDYKKLVDRQVSTITASCTQSGNVILDGKSWFACPGEKSARVLSGEHVVVAEGPGYITHSRRMVLAGGTSDRAEITLMPIETAVRFEYPTRRWIPWSVAIGGAVVGLAGVPVYYAGRRQLDRFEKEYETACAERCELDLSDQPALRDQYDSAIFKGRAAVSMMIGGGVIAASGVIWALVFNQPRRVMPVVEANPATGAITTRVSWQF